MTIVFILAAILIFGVLIAVHELGHFLAAKSCGVRVNEFSIGMGPALWHKQKGETQYSLRALPIGGFCALEGEDEDSEDPSALNRQGFFKKLWIFAAGSLMNFITGFLIILLLYVGATGFYTTALTGFAPEFPSQGESGLQKGDEIVSVNGERIYLYSDLGLLLGLGNGKTADLVVLRDGQKVKLNDLALPLQSYTSSDGSTYTGYGLYFGETVPATALNKLRFGWANTMDFVRIVRLSLQMLVTGKAGINDISGPVGIVSTITQVGQSSTSAQDAVENILYFAALIAVNLSVMNLLPLPALDGGKIFFMVIDLFAVALFHRRIPDKYESYINTAGFALLMGFMLIVTFHDVFKLFQ